MNPLWMDRLTVLLSRHRFVFGRIRPHVTNEQKLRGLNVDSVIRFLSDYISQDLRVLVKSGLTQVHIGLLP